MKNTLIASISLAAAMNGATAVQAADLPDYEMIKAMTMTPQEHISNVAKQCFDNWESPECSRAMAYSNRAMAADYFDALIAANTEETVHAATMVSNDCSPNNPYDWVHFADEVREFCDYTIDDAIQTGIRPEQAQYSIFVIGSQAAEGFMTGQGVIEKDIREYAVSNGLNLGL